MNLYKPRIKPHVYSTVLEQETAVIYTLLVPLLTGEYIVEELINKLAGKATAEEIFYALKVLETKGYIEETDKMLPQQAAFWSLMGVDAKTAIARLQQITVSVTSLGGLRQEVLIDMLEKMEVNVGRDGDITIVLTDDYLRPELKALSEIMVKNRRSWMLAKPSGCEIWMGPLFTPETACWQCLADALTINRKIENFLKEEGQNQIRLQQATLPSTEMTAYSLVATELAKWIVQNTSELMGNIITFSPLTLRIQNHAVRRQPTCPVCGKAEKIIPQPVVVSHKNKQFNKQFITAGGHRAWATVDMLQNFSHLISPLTEVVTGLGRLTPANNNNMHVYWSGQNWAITAHNVRGLKRILRSQNAGKGMTDAQAKVSVLCEGIERFSGIFRGDEPRIKDSLQNLGAAGIHPNTCMLFSDRQYHMRWEPNLAHDHSYIPEEFNAKQELEWSPVWSLTNKEWKYLPTAYCYYGHPEHNMVAACSNGCAAGTSMEEAILQGFLELVERDSAALWWYNQIRRPSVDLASFNEPFLIATRAYYRTIGRELWVLDISSDITIPVFAAISKVIGQQKEDILYGFGAHLNPKIAACCAVTELNQMVAGFLALQQQKNGNLNEDKALSHWLNTATLNNQPQLVAATAEPPKRMTDYCNQESDDFLADIQLCRKKVEDLGLEFLVLDQTRPDIGLPVAKVIVPGLRHFWPRFAPGRLYDVPVKMKWLAKPKEEVELNPQPIVI